MDAELQGGAILSRRRSAHQRRELARLRRVELRRSLQRLLAQLCPAALDEAFQKGALRGREHRRPLAACLEQRREVVVVAENVRQLVGGTTELAQALGGRRAQDLRGVPEILRALAQLVQVLRA